jgi:tetratricopeptide (TPR) repeat protein
VIEQILQADRYLQVDQVDKARDVYERVVELDPGNAIAVVGLARCALAEGDDHRAYELASRALEIDPEDDMARRMEARLSEILATRGEDVTRPYAAATPSPMEMRPLVTAPEPATESRTPTPTPTPTRPTPTRPTPTRPTPTAKEPAVHKSLFDRLMGR